MKRFTHFFGSTLMALLLLPMSVKAEQLYPTLTFMGADGSAVRQVEATLGETFNAPRLLCDYPEVLRTVTYSSSNERVATVGTYGDVTLVSAGTTTISAYFAGNDTYGAARAMYTLTVKEATPIVEPTCPEAKYYYNGAELTTMTLKVGDVVDIPMLMGATGGVYRLSAKTVEGIRVAELTQNEAGEDVIKAVGVGNAQFIGMFIYYPTEDQRKECEYSFNIVVEAASTPEEPECPIAQFYYNGAIVESITLKVGESVDAPILGAAGTILSGRAIIEDTKVAQLGADNLIYAVAQGTTTYYVLYTQTTTDGGVMTCEFTLTIIVEAAAPQLADPELSFDATEVNAELGMQFVAPKLVNPHNIELTAINSKWYTNWDSKIASVNEMTGEVTLLGGVGKETITLEFTGNETYKPAIASYIINVTTSGLTVGGILVNSSNASDVMGDNGSIVWDPITHTLTMTNAAITGAGITIEGAPAHVKAAKAEQVIDAGIYYTGQYPLTVVLNGGNAINNVDAGIYTEAAPVVMMGGKESGSIRISASTVGVKAEAFKIYKCYVTAYGNAAGVAVNELGVATGGNLVAQGGIAAQAKSLVLAEDNDGEGIAILTAGVVFKKGTGFINETDGKQVAFVEIGKVVVVPTTTEVTTIDFTQTDPDGNETVIFSGTANDTYNETTGQLEISTSLTDEQVATAMESVVPGSSAWMNMLPGSLVFDIPAGEGTVRIQCMTLPGYTLQVKMEGKAAVSITQVSLGWAEVTYNVAQPVHVVIYLHAANPSAAPARIATSMQDEDPSVGAYIQAVKIAPKNAPDPNPTTAIDIIESNEGENGKVMMNGQLFIIREGRVFNAAGMQIK